MTGSRICTGPIRRAAWACRISSSTATWSAPRVTTWPRVSHTHENTHISASLDPLVAIDPECRLLPRPSSQRVPLASWPTMCSAQVAVGEQQRGADAPAAPRELAAGGPAAGALVLVSWVFDVHDDPLHMDPPPPQPQLLTTRPVCPPPTQPWVHYVPLKPDYSDLLERVDLCEVRDDATHAGSVRTYCGVARVHTPTWGGAWTRGVPSHGCLTRVCAHLCVFGVWCLIMAGQPGQVRRDLAACHRVHAVVPQRGKVGGWARQLIDRR
jgi:hypothetical protein